MRADRLKQEQTVIRSYLLAGGLTLVILVGGFGGWAALASINGAIIGMGSVVQMGKNKEIQHAEGGIVQKLHVNEGDLVKAGDLLVTLDGTRVRAERDVVRKRLFELEVKRQRLFAERDQKDAFVVAEALKNKAGADESLSAVISVQKKLFNAGIMRRKNKRAQLTERIGHLGQEINGLQVQAGAAARKKEILAKEIGDLNELREKQLVSKQRLNILRRESADVESELGRLQVAIAKAKGQITEARLQTIEISETFRDEALKSLESVEGAILELQEKLIAAEDRLARLEIRSPLSGYVHELKLHTLGGVVSPGETVMQIVPDSKNLVIEARLRPDDIDQVTVGSPATLRFTAFNQRTTPLIDGQVIFISPDKNKDKLTGEVYFTARVGIDPGELAKLGSNNITAGMPAEVMMRTSARTALSFLIKPLGDQINRAFRED